jgi:hypothetical protein
MKMNFIYVLPVMFIGHQVSLFLLRRQFDVLLSKHYNDIDDKLKIRVPGGRQILLRDLSDPQKAAAHGDIKRMLKLRRAMKIIRIVVYSIMVIVMISVIFLK